MTGITSSKSAKRSVFQQFECANLWSQFRPLKSGNFPHGEFPLVWNPWFISW